MYVYQCCQVKACLLLLDKIRGGVAKLLCNSLLVCFAVCQWVMRKRAIRDFLDDLSLETILIKN